MLEAKYLLKSNILLLAVCSHCILVDHDVMSLGAQRKKGINNRKYLHREMCTHSSRTHPPFSNSCNRLLCQLSGN